MGGWDCDAVALKLNGPRGDYGRGAGGGSGSWAVPAGATTTSGGSSSSTSFLSSASSLTDDDEEGGGATSSPPDRRVTSSSSSSLTSSEEPGTAMQMDVAARGPLFELSTMLDHLPALRTGLSKYYEGRSKSFTSLADVTCVEDLAKKTTPCTRRTKAPRGHTAALGVKNRLSKTIAKKAPRGTGLSGSNGKPPSYLGKTEMHRC